MDTLPDDVFQSWTTSQCINTIHYYVKPSSKSVSSMKTRPRGYTRSKSSIDVKQNTKPFPTKLYLSYEEKKMFEKPPNLKESDDKLKSGKSSGLLDLYKKKKSKEKIKREIESNILDSLEFYPNCSFFNKNSVRVSGTLFREHLSDISPGLHLYNVNLFRNYYADYLQFYPHNIFICTTKSDTANAIIVTVERYGKLYGYLMESNMYRRFSMYTESTQNVKKQLKILFPWFKISPVLMCNEAVSDLLRLESSNSCVIPMIDIGVLYINKEITEPLNTTKSSKDFIDLVNLLNQIPLYQNSTQINYHISSDLDSDEIRQYIGNSTCIIIFKDYVGEFDIDSLNILGKVNQFFIIMERVNVNLYMIQSINKMGIYYEPKIPSDCIIDKLSIVKFVLSKFYNGLMELRSNSGISYMYTNPRMNSINEFRNKYRS